MAVQKCGIYAITHVASGKRYVGQSIRIRTRWNSHRSGLERGHHSNIHLQRAWSKHGKESFRFDVLEVVKVDELTQREQYWIDTLQPEYNLAPAAGSNRGIKQNPDAVARRAESLTGQKRTPEQCERISSAKRDGFAKRRAAGIRHPSAMKGKHHTAEARRQISESKRGHKYGPYSLERRQRISESLKGKTVPMDRRNRISQTLTGTSTGRGQLNPDQVCEIRRIRSVEGIGRIAIAKRLSISPSAAGTVIGGHGYLWVA